MSEAIDRKTLASIVAMVRPALATAAYVPALTHIRFDGETACAYNDVAAILVTAQMEYEGCLPGEQLARALTTFSADKVLLERMEDGSTLVKSGRSKLKVPTMKLGDFPMPKIPERSGKGLEIDAAVIRGIRLCLMNVGNDPTHPAQMGVTLDADDKGNAVLFSTDNSTISRFQTATQISLPGDSPVIMPTFFCQQLIGMWDHFREEGAKLTVGSDHLVAVFGKNKATVFSKVMPELEALDFPKQIQKVTNVKRVKDLTVDIPDSWDACFQRAMLVLEGESDKITQIKPVDEAIKLHTQAPMGQADDQISTSLGECISDPILVDPGLILRASKHVAKVTFTGSVTILTNEDSSFIHLIAHCVK